MHRNRVGSPVFLILLSAILALTVILPGLSAYGAEGKAKNALEITLSLGKSVMIANGVSVACQKPYKAGNVFYIPAKVVFETLGADVESSNGIVVVTFREAVAKLKAGSKEVILNQGKKFLSAPPILSGNTLMIPLDFLKLCFDINTIFDEKTGKAVIQLKEDGSLTDLSFLTGSITTTKAGNSYFGWNISLPKGTVVASKSFSSKYVQFENEQFGFDLEVFADYSEGKSLKQYYVQLKEDPGSLIEEDPLELNLKEDANPQYIEILYTDSYEEAVNERIYIKNGNYIDVIATSYDEVDPTKLKKDKMIQAMMDSFSLSYKGNSPDTADLSSVSNGLAKYSSFLNSETDGKKYLTWEMSILPEWDQKSTGGLNQYNTEFDGKPGEYVKVELDLADENEDIDTRGNKLVEFYRKNFNPACFVLLSSGTSQIAGYRSFETRFDVKYGNKKYSYTERLIAEKGILYDITFKSPSESFSGGMDQFDKMFATLKINSGSNDKISGELQKNAYNMTKNNVGKDDALTIYENKTYKWRMTLPGYWQKNSSSGQILESFYESKAGAVIAVEASAIKAGETAKPDKERFTTMKLSDKVRETPLKTETSQWKGRTVTTYVYRIDDEKSETYADITYSLFDEGGYRYCFMTTLPDLTSSEYNLESLKSIWESFEITK